MALATYYKDGRRALAEMLRVVDGASTPSTVGRLLTCTIGNGNAPEFQVPNNPPPVDPDDVYPGIRGAVLGSNSSPLVQYLVPAAEGVGTVVYDGENYTESTTPTDLILFTWLFDTAEAVGQWREIVFSFARSNRLFMGIHPRGTASAWQTKTGTEQRPVRLLLEL